MKGKKVKVAIEDVWRIYEERKAINKLHFQDIVWTKNGKEIKFSQKAKDDFKFTGLSNIDFITSSFTTEKHGNLTILSVAQLRLVK